MAEISPQTQKLIQKYQAWYRSLEKEAGVATIHVDEVATRVASFYEKIRGVVDWREEHLLRKGAIERGLKRRLFLQKNGKSLAEPFVLELIRGGHFPNDQIEERKIENVGKVLDKYLFILENSEKASVAKLKIQLYDWLLGIAACEIEEILAPAIREEALIEYMAQMMKEKIVIEKMAFEEREAQIQIAVQRALFKLDKATIGFYLLKAKYLDWENLEGSALEKIAANIYSIWEKIEEDLKHRLAEKFYRICERYDTAYLILGDIISQNPKDSEKNISQPEILESKIRENYQRRFFKLKSRLTRAAIYSVISIFATKMLIAFAIEVPFEKYILGGLNYQTLGFNIVIPPLLMFLLVLTIRPPKKENQERVVMEVMKLAYEKEKKDIYPIKTYRKRGIIFTLIIGVFYLLTFFVSFGIIIFILNRLDFGILSIVIFLMFFSLISFAGVKIRERAKELEITEKKPGFFVFLIDTFSLPFLRVGRWLSSQWAKYNIIVVLITALIDMPFQLFTEFLEHWRNFLKEKKEEIH